MLFYISILLVYVIFYSNGLRKFLFHFKSENVSFSEEWQRFARSVETPMENWNLLSGEQQVRNASELDLMEGTKYLMMGIDVTLPFFSVVLLRLVKEIKNLILYLLSLITTYK